MNKVFFILISLLLFQGNRLFCQTLSENAEVSLLTIAPGAELWSFAGHTAIRVRDTNTGIDINFNYGLFDFRTDSFYLKFFKNTLPYQIGAYNFRQEVPYWLADHRRVTQQVLRLDSTQKQQIFDFLVNNYKPENREYMYKFFYDNCSTRVRDVLQNACGDSLAFSETLHAKESYRSWIDLYNQKCKSYWVELGMDILAGIPADVPAGHLGAMYIPDNLMSAFDSAKVYQDGRWISLVSQKFDHNDETINHKSNFIKPLLFFGILFLLILGVTFMEYQNKKWYIWIDKVLFSVTGLLGWFMLSLWFLTSHGVMNENLNLLWAFAPLFPAVLFLNRKAGTQTWLKYLFFIQMLLVLLLLLGFSFLPQEFHVAIIPIACLILTRSYFLWKRKS
ncbi:MAG: hypothetical protein ACI97P_002150 [Arcticibacterium sp.]|jgi:hypothetical protein